MLRNECYGQDLEQRKRWYSPSAEAYYQVRPRYPQALIDHVIEIAQLSSRSTLLEVGCGPAIATPAFALLGCPMVCVDIKLNIERDRSYSKSPILGDLGGEDLSQSQINLV